MYALHSVDVFTVAVLFPVLRLVYVDLDCGVSR
jgi:hypothetical protein